MFLICCLVSRILTTIYYIEDTDSLRFALSINDYDITKLQPHFPGYPIYCFLAKILYFFTKSFAVSFSILGAVSIFSIIFFLLKIMNTELQTIKGALLAGLVFFNPLLWLMSNRYMPDLMGLAFTLSAFYFLCFENNYDKKLSKGFLLTGLLAGLRLSFLPVLIVPACYNFFYSNKKIYLILAFAGGCFVWLVPLIWMSGFENLFNAALKQTQGHFADFGGTIITESNALKRLLMIIRSIWADGLGGYWIGRSWQTLFLSFFMIYTIYLGLKNLKELNKKENYFIFFSFVIVYGLWIFFFQNVIYKSRHILPLLIPFILVLYQGGLVLLKRGNILNMLTLGVFFIFLVNVTTVLFLQHKNPSAISSIKDQLIIKDKNQVVISTPLINYYLKHNGVIAEFFDIDSANDIQNIIDMKNDSLILIGNFKGNFLKDYELISDSTFFHNPYVNQMWSEISMYIMTSKTNVNGS